LAQDNLAGLERTGIDIAPNNDTAESLGVSDEEGGQHIPHVEAPDSPANPIEDQPTQ
jgi:hypothetical protein